MLWTFYVGFSHLPMSMGHHNTTRPAISVVFLRKAQCQAYLISFFFFLLGLSTDIGTQYTLYVSCSCGKNVKNKVKWNLDPESFIDAPVQPAARFWSFKLEEQRAGTTFTICIETFNCYFLLCPYRDSDVRLFSFKESMGSFLQLT